MSISASYPNLRPTLLLDFANSGRMDPRVTFTRASTATYFDETGVLQSAAIDTPRFDYDPSTLAAQGLLIEEARTNGIRNNTMVGAVAGTPGTAPTNWSGASTVSGLTREIVGTGTENGITYIDVKYSGTTSAALSNSSLISFEPANQAAASLGQTWTHAVYLRVAAGSMSGITDFRVRINETDGTTVLSNGATSVTPTTAALATQRYSHTRTTVSAGITHVQPVLSITAPISSAIDITLRIGLPQLELGAFATSVIPTTTTALTRSADVASVNTLSPWYRADEGTLFAEFQPTGAPANASAAAAFTDGTTNNYIYIGTRAGSNTYGANSRVGAGTVESVGSFGASNTSLQKAAFAYKTGDYAATFNSAAVATGVNTVPTVDRLNFGAVTSTNRITGYFRRITYYPRRLSNAELQAITT